MHQRSTKQLGEACVRPGIFGSGDGVGGNEVHAGGEMRRHLAQHGGVDRAHVGERGARRQMRTDLFRHRAALPDRDADDDEIGAFHRLGIGLGHVIGDAELAHPLARGRGPSGGHDRARRPLRTGGARNRRADQAAADQGESVEQRSSRSFARALLVAGLHHVFPTNRPAR